MLPLDEAHGWRVGRSKSRDAISRGQIAAYSRTCFVVVQLTQRFVISGVWNERHGGDGPSKNRTVSIGLLAKSRLGRLNARDVPMPHQREQLSISHRLPIGQTMDERTFQGPSYGLSPPARR